jgi:hypothetical protein
MSSSALAVSCFPFHTFLNNLGWNDAGSNCQWIQTAVNEATSLGVNVGMYSSEYEWGATVGSCKRLPSLVERSNFLTE